MVCLWTEARPVCPSFRVRSEYRKAKEVRDRPAVNGTFHMAFYDGRSDAEAPAVGGTARAA